MKAINQQQQQQQPTNEKEHKSPKSSLESFTQTLRP